MCIKHNNTIKVTTTFAGYPKSYWQTATQASGTPIDCIVQEAPTTHIAHLLGMECIVSLKQTRGAGYTPLGAIIGTIAGVKDGRLIINAPDSRVGSFQPELANIKKVEVIRFWCDRNEPEDNPVEIARRHELALRFGLVKEVAA